MRAVKNRFSSAVTASCLAAGAFLAVERSSYADQICTTQDEGKGTNWGGGGTWGDILKLCADDMGNVVVSKYDGTPFIEDGRIWIRAGLLERRFDVFAGQPYVESGGNFEPDIVSAYLENAKGNAWTQKLDVSAKFLGKDVP